MRTLKGICLLLLAVFFYSILASPAFAQVVVNEVNPAPSSGNDWIELYNVSSQSANLTDWSVQDSSSVLTTSPLLAAQSIAGYGFLVVEVSNRLNNTGDQVKLFNANAQLADSFTYDHSVSDESWARNQDGVGPFQLAFSSRGLSNNVTPTPQATTLVSPTPAITPAPSQSPSPSPATLVLPSHIIVSEIMACPNTGEAEWVELQNSDDAAYSLTNWQIKDSQNNSRTFSTQISSQGLVVVEISPAMLNNSGGDQVFVVRSDGVTTSSASYTSCIKGKSLVFDGGNWVTAEPTPGFTNADSTSSDEVSDAETLNSGTVLGSESDSASFGDSSEKSASEALTNSQAISKKVSYPVELAYPNFDESTVSAEKQLSLANSQKFSNKKANTPSQKNSSLYLSVLLGSSLLILLSSVWLFFSYYTKTSEDSPGFFE